MKFIHLTDIHLMPPGQSVSGSDPIEKLSKVFEDIATWHSDAEFCVVSGDLADLGDRESYEWLRQRLAHFPVPVFLMLGNHDVRETFISVFSRPSARCKRVHPACPYGRRSAVPVSRYPDRRAGYP